MSTIVQDLRYGLRMLAKNPGFTTVAVLTLALGIGATTAIFGALDATLLRPFPFRDPDRLVMVWGTDPKEGGWRHTSIPDYFEWKSHNSAFTSLAGYGEAMPVDIVAQNRHFRARAVPASSNLFSTLGVRAALGSGPLVTDDHASSRDAIISFHLWVERFGTRRGVLGQQIEVNKVAYRVVAVLPINFPLPFAENEHYDLLLPLSFTQASFTDRGDHVLHLLGRLRRGVSLAWAEAESRRIAAELARDFPQFDRDLGARLGPLSESRASLRSPLWILLTAVAFLLLIACGNMTGLQLARGLVRGKELAVRAALGASRRRLFRQLLLESTLLASLGGAVGFLLAVWGTGLLVALGSVTAPQLAVVRMDWRAAVWAALITVSTLLLAGLAPSLELSRVDLHSSLKGAGVSATAGSRHARFRSLLVTMQMGLAAVLLSGAGLLLHSFYHLILTNPGVRIENLLTADLSKPAARSAQTAFYDELLSQVRAVPHVQYAAAVSSLPLGSEAVAPMPSITVAGSRVEKPPDAMTRVVTPSYFAAMEIPLVEGRDFTAEDSAAAERVAIVNQLVARQFFPGGHATGRELEILPGRTGAPFSVRPGLVLIVGVVGDVMHWFTGGDPHLDYEVYLPYAQTPVAEMTLVVRATNTSPLLALQLEAGITKLDQRALIGSVTTMQRELSDTVAPRRFYPALLTAFALVALLLAAAGIYGVLAHFVRQRSHEIGIRLALGARPAAIVRLVVVQGLRPGFIGAMLGVAGGLGAARFLQSLLYGVRPTDPVTLLGVVLVLAIVLVAAAFVPARRATKVDPIVALRYE